MGAGCADVARPGWHGWRAGRHPAGVVGMPLVALRFVLGLRRGYLSSRPKVFTSVTYGRSYNVCHRTTRKSPSTRMSVALLTSTGSASLRSRKPLRKRRSRPKASQTCAEMRANEDQDRFKTMKHKTTHLCDKGDHGCMKTAENATRVKWNPSLGKGMTPFAESPSAVQDYRDARVNRLEKNEVCNSSGYGLLCEQTKSDWKGTFNALSREAVQKRKLEQIKMKMPQNQPQIVQVESDLQRASVEASRNQHASEQQVHSFQAEITDMKKVLTELVNTELVFHAKALEFCALCFQTLNVIDPGGGLEEFKLQMKPADAVRRTQRVWLSSSP